MTGTDSPRRRRAGGVARGGILAELTREPRPVHGSEHHHRDIRGGAARAAVFGVSDGLVTNVALILGVAGAHPHRHVVVLVGVAGMLAGSLSMAAGEYISMRAQSELFERELELEARELRRHPQAEQRELATIYQSRGLDAETAASLAEKMMVDPATALHTHAREELGIDPYELGSPWKASGASLVATTCGAAVPLLPWLIAGGGVAIGSTIAGSAVLAVAVGWALARFTGRPAVLVAARQVAICAVAAAVTFGVGSAVGVSGA